MFKKRNFTKALLVMLALVTMLSFAACSSREETPDEDSSSTSQSQSSSTSSKPDDDDKDDAIGDNVSEPSGEEDDNTEPEEPEATTLEKIADAKAQNSDVKGWITIPGTLVDDEILQASDNIYYERRDITKNYNWYGCYFLDAGNVLVDRSQLTDNTIIYGHNMDDDPNGRKFAQLMNYLDVDFAKENPYIYITTETDQMVFQIFSSFYTDISFQYHLEKPDDATFANIISDGKARSELIYDVDVDTNDKILTLSTCTYKYGGAENEEQRFVIQAKLLDAGATLEDSVTVTLNPSPKAPTFSKQY